MFFFFFLSQGADVVRLWNLHQTLLYFDYDSEDSNEVKDLLLECFMSVRHIKKEEVSKFFVLCFSSVSGLLLLLTVLH